MKVKLMLIGVIVILSCSCAAHRIHTNDGQVQLYLKASQNQQAFFVCSLDGFMLHEARRSWRNEWVVTMPADKAFRYFYLVNDKAYLPPCPYREKDDFGSENCLYLPEM